jgi:hypothetical protein
VTSKLQALIAITLICITMAACNNNSQAKDETQEQIDKGNETARKIKTLDEAIRMSTTIVQTIPLADGGAYIVTDYGTWYLKETKSSRVSDVTVVPTSTSSKFSNQHLWALWQTETSKSQRLRKLVAELEEQESESDSEPEEE